MKLSKKLVFVFLFFLFAGFSLRSPIWAMDALPDAGGGNWYAEPKRTWYDEVFVLNPQEINSERWTLATFQSVEHSIYNALSGKKEVIAQGPNGPTYVYSGGAVDILANLNGVLYTSPPATTANYIAYMRNNFGLTEPAYAQGLGFGAFSSLINIWGIFRNIAYVGLALIFIVVGIMIMFRTKIDPRTVMTVQESIPRLVLTLLLITFSYAIAGIVIDLAEFATRLVANTLVDGKLLGLMGKQRSINDLLSSDTFKLVNPLRNIDDLIGSIGSTSMGGNLAIEILAKITVSVVFWVAGFFIMFKIFFALLGPYVSIILSVIFAPLQLLMGALPGSNQGLSSWLRQLVANAAVFPVTFGLLAISAILQSGPTLNKCDPSLMAFGGAGGSALWCTPTTQFSLLWTPIGINLGTAVGHIAGFGILFTIPKVADIVKEALQYKPSTLAGGGADEIKARFASLPFMKSFMG